MPDLSQILQNKDPGFIRIVADLWGIDLGELPETPGSPREVWQRLGLAMLEPDLIAEIVEILPANALDALNDLAQNDGSLAWALFTRRYGEVREMGAARRDREQPHRHPASPAEALWYRALVGRAFLDTSTGPQEFAFIPNDLLALLPAPLAGAPAPAGKPASSVERAFVIPADDHILDHACTLLAAQRLGLSSDSAEFRAASWDLAAIGAAQPRELRHLLSAAGLLDPASGLPHAENLRKFLEQPRAQALAFLFTQWQSSSVFNDLRLLPGLSFEGNWANDPLRARQAILAFLQTVPLTSWWSLGSFCSAIQQAQPDFQRPAGDYDSWYIRDTASSEFLRGYQHWSEVEGALIRYILCGPLHWLGILDLAAPAANQPPAAFRFTAWGGALLNGEPPEGLDAEDDSILVSSDARLRAPRLVPRIARYQLARFSAWENANQDTFAYRLTPASLERARKQGLRVSHLLLLLRKSALSVPPSLVRALERWEEQGSEAHIEQALVLRLRTPELLQALLNSRARRFLGDVLGPTAVIVNPGAWEKVLLILAEMGYLGEMLLEDW